MKSILLCPIVALATVATLGAQENKPAEAKPAEAPAAAPAKADPAQMDKVSYFIGTQIGGDFKRNGLEIVPETLLQGIKDALAEKKDGKYTEAELSSAMQAFQMAMMAKQQEEIAKQQAEMEKATAELAKAGPKNKEDGEKFLADNGKRDGVTTTASGLQYEVLKKADGPKPKATDEVTVHYKGTLINGDEFDSSEKHGQPATFPLNGVIPGWTEGVQLMSVGSKFKFFIPAKLAYGEQVRPPKIGPNSTLVFEVELLNIGGEGK
ncbi:FKBP-type peptidyl-prolyl cis-trans isomerase FkpA/FKBP-type peptidyl-prolyl cis-trans isomerase FklB [Roseimicrobium gellanilyticum]|uniref:Peptidyl-prolyl cis-trans isomerase n=1 Tax=Roseimicrobium gellanilyticum TaxID=748857 RepID=A0A366H5X7_9BACT|nr:FKBP-type peptidyl-prolyl cis-trans isomerase [Roseimicrobium gellanilyticum]RBP37332.1 FKBP-type peptidyl-prolyl cis-trans isomerase FkpA/FKBP-type peptidyl-prolyl cis-trans isomerase FklB [Roseimicrobium gellanilyticum]